MTGLTAVIAAPVATLACSPVAVNEPSVSHGDQCMTVHLDPEAPYSVRSTAVVDLGGGIVRQQLASGVCGSGQRIVAYFDCGSGTGAWLGGPVSPAGLQQADPGAVNAEQGADETFISREEPRLAGGPRPDAVLNRARQLKWVAQSGAIESARLRMDGKPFDLNCGCKMFYPKGVKQP